MSKPNAGSDTGTAGLPRPFSQAEIDQIRSALASRGALAQSGPAPTTLSDCMANGQHGGKKGDRVYYPSSSIDMATGKLDKGPAVCEICGLVGVEDA